MRIGSVRVSSMSAGYQLATLIRTLPSRLLFAPALTRRSAIPFKIRLIAAPESIRIFNFISPSEILMAHFKIGIGLSAMVSGPSYSSLSLSSPCFTAKTPELLCVPLGGQCSVFSLMLLLLFLVSSSTVSLSLSQSLALALFPPLLHNN